MSHPGRQSNRKSRRRGEASIPARDPPPRAAGTTRKRAAVKSVAPSPDRSISPLALDHLLDLMGGPEPDRFRREYRLPELPAGVRGASDASMAMDDTNALPYATYLQGQSAGGQLNFGLYFPGYPYLCELAQRSEYRQPVETTAKEMTRRWIEFKSKGAGDKKDKIAELEDEFTKFDVQNLFRKVTEHDGFYGLGFIYVRMKRNADRATPLMINENTITKGSLDGFQTIEPIWSAPIVWNSTDPGKADFYNPTRWFILGMETHASRLLKFISRPVPDIIKPAYNFGGISLTQLLDPYVQRWLRAVDAVNRLIVNFSIITLQTDMSAILAGGNPEKYGSLLKRIKLFIKNRDSQGVFLTDKGKELLEQLAVPLSGLSELQAQAQEHMAAPTHLPLVVLTGITPAGLNASSQDEIQVFYDWIHSMQEQLYRPNLMNVMHILMLNKWGAIDPDITFDFHPLQELTGEAAARVRQADAEAAATYTDLGAVDGEEVRERLAHDRNSGWNNLDLNKKIEPPDLEVQEGAEAGEKAASRHP